MDIDNAIDRIRSRAFAVRHKAIVRAFCSTAPYFIVNEYPKCGGTWLAQMLADALGVPFRRNAPIRLERSVTHGHFLSPLGLKNVVVIWRDPRDALVSLYFHSYFVNEHDNALLVRMMKEARPFNDYVDIRSNLPEFIRFVTRSPFTPRFSWPQFARTWSRRKDAVHTSYEALRSNTVGELTRVISSLVGVRLSPTQAQELANTHSFERARENAKTSWHDMTEVSFLREGSMGGWRRHFTPEAVTALQAAGYEPSMRRLGYDIDG